MMEEQKLLRRRAKALKSNNERVLSDILIDLANLYLKEERFDFAIEEYKSAAKIFKNLDQHSQYATANRGIGEAYLGLRNFDKAIQYHKLYLDASKSVNKMEEQRALATMGHTLLTSYMEASDKNHLNQAYKYFTESLRVCKILNGEVSRLEIADMSARLYSNLGLVQDYLGNFSEAIELVSKSIDLCKANDIYEQLHRAYISLASIYEKRGDRASALQQYNLALDTSKKMSYQPILMATTLLSKSELLVHLGDLNGAKYALHKAYRLNIPHEKERETIENNLRIVATMCSVEKKLLSPTNTDAKKLKELYEKMGDGCCELKSYENALQYYQKMLDSANKASASDTELAACYYSLAETYKDNGQYTEAITNFEKELELCKSSLSSSLNTLSKIADTKETANAPVEDLRNVYRMCLKRCQEEGNAHEEGRMLKRFIGYLRRQNQHSEAFQQEQLFLRLDYVSSDSDGESSDSRQTCAAFGADIDLEAITDGTDGSDGELGPASKPRRRSKAFTMKKNLKGETQLHTACITGNLKVVRHLLEQGHLVNVRDNCGWLPLHEACICGHLEIVEVLLKKGAAINDRGGTQCGGITPLHDAASNGHLHIVRLLLSKGANAVAKSDDGATVLQFLRKWRLTEKLDPETESLYQTIIKELSAALEKAGHKDINKPIAEKAANTSPLKSQRRSRNIGLEEDEDSHSTPLKSSRNGTPVKNMRRSRDVGLEDGGSPFSDITDDYRNVMDTLRNKNKPLPKESKAKVGKRSALLTADEMVDDWLEDDIARNTKKRRTSSPVKSQKSVRRASAASLHADIDKSNDSYVNEDVDFQCNNVDLYYEPLCTPSTSRPKQSSLINAGFSRKTESPIKISASQQFSGRKRKHQSKLTTFGHTRMLSEADSTVSPSQSRISPRNMRSFDEGHLTPFQTDSTLAVDVKIDGKLYRVPVLLSQINTHTIKWLAEEAASRYAKKEYIKPTLELETKNGAILANDDLLNLLFPAGTTQAEPLTATIIKWITPPIIDRYKEACQDLTTDPNQNICQALQELSINLNLSNKGLKGSLLAPLCKAINRQTNLLELDLSGNFLNNECILLLSYSLPSLKNLQRLKLSCTGLDSQNLQQLTVGFENYNKISDLDLSDNLICDQSLETLSKITQKLQLKSLNLSCNKFSKEFLKQAPRESFAWSLNQLEHLNVSDNQFCNEALIRLVSWLTPNILKSLNLGRNAVSPGFFKGILLFWPEGTQLGVKSLILPRCHLTDSEIFYLLQLSYCLEYLDVSYNASLTCTSLRRLLQKENILELNIFGCLTILEDFSHFIGCIDAVPQELNQRRSMKISVDLNKHQRECEYLIKLWKHWFGSRTKVEQDSHLLFLSVST